MLRRTSIVTTLVFSLAIAASCGRSTGDVGFRTDAGSGPKLDFDGGSTACNATGKVCVANDIHTCNPDGTAGEKVGSCDGKKEVCIDGACAKGCAAADALPSNIGCEFWAVDLDNNKDPFNDAAGAPWGIVVSNAGDETADVIVEQNDAEPGQAPQVKQVKRVTLSPGTVQTITMPTREVDGSLLGNNEGPGTMLSSRAFRVSSSQPIVVYQFNALAAQYSNDASLLLPSAGLGLAYRALSWPAGKPISVFGSPIDRAYVTIVGTRPGTHVRVKVSNATLAGGTIPATPKDGVINVTIGPYDVLNLETDGLPGDMTGTVVTADQPVAVFTGTELSGAPGNKKPPAPPGIDGNSSSCCLDHLEEQLLPVESYGKRFAIPHSAYRSDPGGYRDYDVLRFMGVAATATIKTNLPAPDDSFTLAPGEVRETYTDRDFVAESTEPVAIAQILVSQGYTPKGNGDPSLTIFPAVDQFRADYLFSVPTSWRANFIALALPKGASVTVDGAAPTGCDSAPMGTIGGVDYIGSRCPISEGAHTLVGTAPFGLAAYGYGTAGSYAFVGGANVKKIYTPPPTFDK